MKRSSLRRKNPAGRVTRRVILQGAGAALAWPWVKSLSALGAGPTTAEGPGGTLTARAFDPDGKPADPRQLNSLLLIDDDARPFELIPQMKGDGVCTIGLPNQPFQLMMRLKIRDFGEVYCYADDVRGPEAVLNYEFARSRAATVRSYVTKGQAEGVTFSDAMLKRLEAGEASLKQATAAADVPTRVRLANDSLAETMWAGELAVNERAQHRIRRNGARPGFLFGANCFNLATEEYRQRFLAAFDFGTVPFYRNTTERTEGTRNYAQAERILQAAAGTPLLLKGHPLLWLNRQQMPRWLLQKSWSEVKTSSRDYALGTVSRYRSRIHSWDVINEAHDWANEFKYSPEQTVELTAMMSQAAREADPTCFRVVNNCCLWAEYVATRLATGGARMDRPSQTPLGYMKAVHDAKVDYDAVGLQIYCPGRDMLEIERHIERFAALGKPLHITELGIPSANDQRTTATYEERGNSIPYPIDAVWHGTAWSEQIQADWVEQFYTLCFSMPQVEAITWWDFSDPGYMPGGGFLTRDLRPKPVYERLLKLIGQWRS